MLKILVVLLLLGGILLTGAVLYGPIHYPLTRQDPHESYYTIIFTLDFLVISVPAILAGLLLLFLGRLKKQN